ncbi:MAG: hypothetical protein H6618_04910 [Deltaproteobacteria bacterium]|nr:hypothetical protein [Deltaproteobacteria bacterium]
MISDERKSNYLKRLTHFFNGHCGGKAKWAPLANDLPWDRKTIRNMATAKESNDFLNSLELLDEPKPIRSWQSQLINKLLRIDPLDRVSLITTIIETPDDQMNELSACFFILWKLGTSSRKHTTIAVPITQFTVDYLIRYLEIIRPEKEISILVA